MTAEQGQALVLVADSDRASREAALDHLVSAGYTAVGIANGDELHAALNEERKPDLVILDVALPGADSFAVCDTLKQGTQTKPIPVILLAAASRVEDRVRAMDVCADDLLDKPVEPQELIARTRALLRVKAVYDGMAEEIRRLTAVGIALSAERNLNRLLERIVDEARAITHADAGTLYTVDPDAGVLLFQIMQNESMGTRMGGERGDRIELPPVPLNPSNVSAYVALTGKCVNIPDVYQAEGFDFSGPRRYDAVTGYRSTSMLVVPMRNHEDEVIGVLQLINAQDPATGQVMPFRPASVESTQALASQAGIAITNARLILDLEAFLEGLIQVMAAAVDEKSHYTAGHIKRVTDLALYLAEAVNACPDGRFEGRRFSRDELNELRVAGLLHDIGKIVVPEHVVDKATKLSCVYDRIHTLRARFSVIRRGMENAALRRKLELVQAGAPGTALMAVEEELATQVAGVDEDLAFLESINPGGEFMAPDKLQRLQEIAARNYRDDQGQEQPWLTENEVRNLSIPKGTLLPEEFDIIRGHVAVSARLLSQIPFSRKLRNVPVYAGEHHEALNGSGYPYGKSGEDLSLQSRILAVVDILDALTSSDRPYKKAFPPEVAYRILREEAERGKLDARLVELIIEADCYNRLQRKLSETQADPAHNA